MCWKTGDEVVITIERIVIWLMDNTRLGKRKNNYVPGHNAQSPNTVQRKRTNEYDEKDNGTVKIKRYAG